MRQLRLTPLVLGVFLLAACDTEPEVIGPEPSATEVTDANAVVASATGSAHYETAGELRNVTFSATERADGSVQGEFHIAIHAFDAFWHTRVECLTVVDNRAFIGGTITSASDERVQVGSKSYFWVDDNGGDGPDRVAGVIGVNETQEGMDDFCELRQNLLPGTDVLQGNVTVR